MKLNWREIWIKNGDYICNRYLKIREKYKIVDESIDYYIVMLEMAINYLNNYENYYDYGYVQHRLFLEKDFFDKNNLKLDLKEYDFAECLKYVFFKEIYDIDDIYDLLEKEKNKFNYELIVARLLYPNYYFFYLEKYIEQDDSSLLNIISRSLEYEEYVKKIVNKINEFSRKKIALPFK